MRDQGHHVTVVSPAVRSRPEPPFRGTVSRESDTESDPLTSTNDVVTVAAGMHIPVVDLPLVRNTARVRAHLTEVLRTRHIDIVHIHSEFGVTAAAIDSARTLGIPVVQTVHTFFWQAGLTALPDRVAAAVVRSFARWVRGFACSPRNLAPSRTDSALRGITLSTAERVQTVISPSAHQAEALREAGLSNVVVIENASPANVTHSAVQRSADNAAMAAPLTEITLPLRIAWIGRLTPEKRILEFLEAVGIAQRALPQGALRVDVIGDGPLAGAAASALEQLPQVATMPPGDGVVRLLGRLSREEVRERIRASHLVALTSYGFDNQPVTVVEALTESRSVVYVDPNLREGLADGGILADSPDPAGMARTLVRLVQHPQEVIDASARARLAAEVFSPERHAKLLIDTYERASAERR